MDKEIILRIPQPLIRKSEEELKQSPFSNLDELLTFILQNYFDRKEGEDNPPDDDGLRKRLEGLGYL